MTDFWQCAFWLLLSILGSFILGYLTGCHSCGREGDT